jgi:hypothetical protein
VRFPHPRDEQGAAATALLVTALLIGFAAFVYLAVPFGTAVDAKAKNRTAADAAALAGAEGVREDLLAAIGSDGVPGSWTDLPGAAGLGQPAAAEYAALNDGTLVEYWFDPTDGTAHATVEGRGFDGEVSRSSAVAQVDLPSCEALEPPDPPEETEEPDLEDPPATESPAPPPPPVDVSVSCGDFDLVFQVRWTDTGPEVHFPPGQLAKVREAMDVRLVA